MPSCAACLWPNPSTHANPCLSLPPWGLPPLRQPDPRPGYGKVTLTPPSTGSIWPVTCSAIGDTKNSTGRADVLRAAEPLRGREAARCRAPRARASLPSPPRSASPRATPSSRGCLTDRTPMRGSWSVGSARLWRRRRRIDPVIRMDPGDRCHVDDRTTAARLDHRDRGRTSEGIAEVEMHDRRRPTPRSSTAAAAAIPRVRAYRRPRSPGVDRAQLRHTLDRSRRNRRLRHAGRPRAGGRSRPTRRRCGRPLRHARARCR